MSGKFNKILFKKLLLTCFFLVMPYALFSQATDSISHGDTLSIYKKIKRVAYKRKATKLLYHAIFVDPAPQKYEEKPLSDKQKKEDPYLGFKGKIIKTLTIEVYDPFGYSVNDTSKKETSLLQTLGNKYHITTRQRVVRNTLLLKENDTLDPVKLSESERLLRTARYIRDARIYVQQDSLSNDSVHVKVMVHDKWALDAGGSLSSTNGRLVLRDKNIIGSGHRIQQDLRYYLNGDYIYSGLYTIENISNTFIASDAFYRLTNTSTFAGIAFNRPFYTALARWAGGVTFVKTWDTYFYTDPALNGTTNEQVLQKTDLDFHNFDAWIGRSINTGTGKNINRRFNNIVATFRYAERQYEARPSFDIDTNMLNVNSSLYLSSLGFSLSKFYKDQYIFRFGANEDIPEGIIVQLLYGLLYKELQGLRYYAGVDISRGKHLDYIGYISAHASYGSFFNGSVTGNATLNLGLTFFTDLWQNNNWYFRQFLYLKYINGINKPQNERITLRSDELYGFKSGTLQGKGKIILNLEGVTYAPYNIIGFRFAPLVLLGFGMLEQDDVKLFKSHLYQSYAIGLLLRNESLLNSSFQFTFGMYPYLPDGNKEYARFNPVTSITVRFRSFAISKPQVVVYE